MLGEDCHCAARDERDGAHTAAARSARWLASTWRHGAAAAATTSPRATASSSVRSPPPSVRGEARRERSLATARWHALLPRAGRLLARASRPRAQPASRSRRPALPAVPPRPSRPPAPPPPPPPPPSFPPHSHSPRSRPRRPSLSVGRSVGGPPNSAPRDVVRACVSAGAPRARNSGKIPRRRRGGERERERRPRRSARACACAPPAPLLHGSPPPRWVWVGLFAVSQGIRVRAVGARARALMGRRRGAGTLSEGTQKFFTCTFDSNLSTHARAELEYEPVVRRTSSESKWEMRMRYDGAHARVVKVCIVCGWLFGVGCSGHWLAHAR